MKRSLFFLCAITVSAHAWSAQVEVIESADLQKRVARLERMLENPVLLQLSDRLADQEKEIQQLGDQIDRLNWRIKQLQKRHQQDIAALQAQIEDLNAKLAKPAEVPVAEAENPAPTVPAENKEAPAPAAKGLKPADAKATKAYEQAMTLLRKAHYKEAAQAFQAFLKDYGDTQLAPNAAYWAGEAYMAELNYKKGWPYFEQVIKNYPDSNKYDDSLYRGADALYQLGKKKEAVQLLTLLIQDKRAEARLKQRAEKLLQNWKK